jgi:hypothetical protein
MEANRNALFIDPGKRQPKITKTIHIFLTSKNELKITVNCCVFVYCIDLWIAI